MTGTAAWSLASAARMQALDRFTIERLGVPGEILMENAGRALVDFILGHAEEGLASRGAEVVLACGPGNNGGDGFVAARHLTQLGVAVRVVLLADPSGLKGEAAAHHEMAMAVGVPMEVAQSGEGGPLLRRGVLVDALFGTGLTRPLEGRAAHLVERINALADTPEIVVIAVDLPSGIDADTGQPLGLAVAADATLTLGAPKIGLTLEPGRSLAGRVCVGKIGIADAIPGELPEEGAAAAQTLVAGTGWEMLFPLGPRRAIRERSGICSWWPDPKACQGRPPWPLRQRCARERAWSPWAVLRD